MEPILNKAKNQRTAISETQIFVRSRAVVSRVVAGETLIVPVRGRVGDLASIYSFNETGSLIWKILEKPRAGTEVVSEVAEAYEVDADRVRHDAMRFLSDMLAASLIEVCEREVSSVENFLAEVPGAVEVAGTEGPVGREGLAAADAR
jgi:Coenzyme PQQ synthesis protein D (PqqD)